jgi:Uncharacterized conserved protein
MSQNGEIRIGTSGWHYDHWIGRFYPGDVAKGDLLSWYARTFDSVEINNTFYQLPEPSRLQGWLRQTLQGFLFACKASRYITHMKKLKEPHSSTKRFFNVIDTLSDRLGPLLFQLPPNWAVNVERLAEFLAALPRRYRYAFEFRDESWLIPAVYDLLQRHDAALCIYEIGGRRSPVEVTTDFTYVRLHGPAGAYQGEYDDRSLSIWAWRLTDWRDAGTTAFCYFDNDDRAFAVRNAATLREMVTRNRPADADIPVA